MGRVGVTEHGHTERISDQHQIDAGFVKEFGRWKVVCRQSADLTVRLFPAEDCVGSDLIHALIMGYQVASPRRGPRDRREAILSTANIRAAQGRVRSQPMASKRNGVDAASDEE